MTRWLGPPPVTPESLAELNLDAPNRDSLTLDSLTRDLVAQTLIRRGITTPEAARAFLDPRLASPVPASELPGMGPAVERIAAAISGAQPICVWGDFDVDGQTSTTILVQSLQAAGADVTYHIPVRARESHGVNLEYLAPIIEQGAKLILTCDTGISAAAEVEFAAARGVEFVITDHHDLPANLPSAAAIVNPKLLPESHALASLPGAGVAYKLAEALLERFPATSLRAQALQDLAALGIIADLALLKGETRTLAQRGLAALRESQRLGLKVVAELAGLDLAQANEQHIGFILAPRLNALGRLSDANPAVELLTTRDPARARLLAAQIEGLNSQRKLLTDQVYQAAEAQLRADPSLLAAPVIVLAHPAWPGGVVGIVANRLVERYHKPALLLSAPEGEPVHGSARSVEGLNITEAIAANQEFLLGFGGHPMAAGLSLQAEQLPDFRRAFTQTVEKMRGTARLEEPVLQIDAWLPLKEVDLALAARLESLSPFGPGNPALVLATPALTLTGTSPIGRTREHLKLTVSDSNGLAQEVLWWNGAGEELPEGKFDLAYRLRLSSFRGEQRLTLEFEDFRLNEEKPAEIRAPRLDLVDLRAEPDAFARLEVETFAEGKADRAQRGVDRYHLSPSEDLAIQTIPPGPAETRAILEQVKPRRIYLGASAPGAERTEEFLSRLAGLAKFALSRRQGRAQISELASATAQREATVRLGLEWLAAGGHLTLEVEDDQLRLGKAEAAGNPYLQRELFVSVKGLLDETAAYRAQFSGGNPEMLLTGL